MARARNIKPSIMDNEDLAELEPLTRLLFIYLWMLADREGRLEDRPKRIAAQALAYDRTADVNQMLRDLEAGGFIERYKVDGVACIQITAFAKHQTPHIREAASTLPGKDADTTKALPRHVLDADEASPRSPDSGFSDSGYLIADTSDSGESLAPTSIPEKQNPDPRQATAVTMAGAVCVALKSIGMMPVNPSHPGLRALLDSGADIGTFVEIGRECVKNKKPFAYLLAAVKGRMADSAAMADAEVSKTQPHVGILPGAI